MVRTEGSRLEDLLLQVRIFSRLVRKVRDLVSSYAKHKALMEQNIPEVLE